MFVNGAILTMNKVTFQGIDCSVRVSSYNNGQVNIQLFDEEGPYATASICLVGQELPQNYTAIKNYSENEGILDALVEAGVVRYTGVKVAVGMVMVPIVEVLF